MTLNPHAWSKVANVIYLDSPAGVGLSYSATRADYTTNDTHTAQDAEAFLRRFFDEYPEFQRNNFYVAGPRVRRLPSLSISPSVPCMSRDAGLRRMSSSSTQ